MAIHSLVLDGTRHVDNNGFTVCGELIPFGTPWEEDPRDEKPSGKLCKTCYQGIEAADEIKAEKNAQDDAAGAESQLPHTKTEPPSEPKAAKTAKKA